MPERAKQLLVYPWNISSTGLWEENGLRDLRDAPVQDLVEALEEVDTEMAFISALGEYYDHANQRKAAELARAMVQKDAKWKTFLEKHFQSNREVLDDLLVVKLSLIPSRPSEYPRGLRIEYVH